MNLKQLGILLVLVAVLGGAGLVLYRNQSASWQSNPSESSRKLLDKLPLNDIAGLTFAQGTNELNLVKQDESWRVRERHNYPADYGKLRDFLLKAQALKAIQSEKVAPAQLASLHLAGPGQATNAALAVEFRGAGGKPVKTLLLGKPHLKQAAGTSPMGEDEPGWPDGRYVRLGDSDTVAVVSDPLDNIEPKPEAWLNKDFIHIDKAKTIAVTFPVTTNSWKLTRDTETGPWKLADPRPGEAIDSAKTGSLTYPLNSPSFTDVAPGADLGPATNPPTVIKIETFDHFDYTLRLGSKTNQDFPVTVAVTAQIPTAREAAKDEKPEDKSKLDKEFNEHRQKLEDKLKQEQGYASWTYLVSSWTLDPLLQDRSQLLVEKKEEPDKNGKATANAADAHAAPPANGTPSPVPPAQDESSAVTNIVPSVVE